MDDIENEWKDGLLILAALRGHLIVVEYLVGEIKANIETKRQFG